MNQIIDDIEIIQLNAEADVPYSLLLLADPSKFLIDQYLKNSQLFVGYLNKEMIACYVLCPTNETVAEIKNISVVEHLQGRGIGAFLLKDAVQKAKFHGFKKLMIATGNSSVGPLKLYQKLGFRIVEIQKDYFIENYPEPIIENGIQCRDKLVLEMDV